MFQIPWQLYSEEEIQEIVTTLYRERGYEVYNVHKIDRRGEEGVDLECTRPGEAERIVIAVKKKPQKKDIAQLNMFAKRVARTKIYVYVEEPSTSFKKAMEIVKDKVSFWNSEKLTYEVFSTDVRFYLFLIIVNYIWKDFYDITMSFCRVYIDLEERGPKFEMPMKADHEMLNLLWQAKDRSVSLHKSLRTLQAFFEETKLSTVNERTKESITDAFLLSLSQLHRQSLRPLKKLFHDFLKKYPANFEKFCEQTKDGSNWIYFLSNLPQLSPGYVIKSLERGYDMYREIEEFLPIKSKGSKEELGEILGNVSRILANGPFFVEDAVDDLLSIGLLGKWDAMREKFPDFEDENLS